MSYVCDVLYAVLYACVSCFVVRGCAVSRRYRIYSGISRTNLSQHRHFHTPFTLSRPGCGLSRSRTCACMYNVIMIINE